MSNINGASSAGRLSGALKWFDRDKGYGFIERSGAPDVFLHAARLPRAVDGTPIFPNDGQKISFNISSGDKGLRAVDVEFE
jgi:cold shock protein